MTLAKMFSLFSNEKLKEAFDEYQEHEETGIVKDGILRSMVDLMLMDENDINQNIAELMANVEEGLLKEIARRFYNK